MIPNLNVLAVTHARLRVGEGRAKAQKDFHRRAKYQLAAQIWHDGVDLDEALEIAEKTFQEEGVPGKGRGKGKSKAQNSPKGKGRRKGS